MVKIINKKSFFFFLHYQFGLEMKVSAIFWFRRRVYRLNSGF